MKRFSLFILFIVFISCFLCLPQCSWTGESDQIFWQEESIPVTLPNVEPDEIVQIAADYRNQLWVLTANALWVLSEGRWRQIDSRLQIEVVGGMRMYIHPKQRGIRLFVGPNGVFISPPGARVQFLQHDFGPVAGIAVTQSGGVWIAAENGLFQFSRRRQEIQKIDSVQSPVNTVTANNRYGLAAGTANSLSRYNGESWRNTYTGGLIDEAITSLAFDPTGNLWIGNSACINQQKVDSTFERIGGQQGLPYNQINILHHAADNSIWIGTGKGAIRHHNNEWNYYHGPRWLLGNQVKSIASVDNAVYVLTEKGINQIEFKEWTLAEKAEYYKSLVYPRHDRHGLVADVHLNDFSRPFEYTQRDNDNDGLWTAIYLASLCFEYAVTGNEEVKNKAWYHFEAMKRLESVTGKPGFFARSYVKKGEPHEAGGEWHESPDSEWIWKGDTSSDELVGHMFVYPIVYDLIAETEDEKQRVRELVSRIMNHVVDNGFYLIDIDGEPTRWGVWAPEKLNQDPSWHLERGLNSLQILSFLISAHHITGNEKYMLAYDELVNEHGYLLNIINQKITKPTEVNHSDDELAFLPYYNLIRYAKDERLQEALQKSLQRSWRIEQPEKSTLWNFIYAASGVEEYGQEGALWTLREWPISLVSWPVENSHRLDITIDRHVSRFDRKQSVEVLPPGERPMGRWNANPYRLDSGGSQSVDDPGAWLLPYWMGRYHGFIE